MFNLIGCILGDKAFDSRLEFAIRSRAQGDPAMMARVHHEDLTQTGYISIQVEETVEARLARIPSYVPIYTGVMPNARGIARLQAQHRPAE